MNEAQLKRFAYEIASTLDDVKSLGVHEALVHKYSEEFLREQLAFIMSLKEEKISRSRAAYFMHLVYKRGGASRL